jgi:hypothetical protein
MLLALASGYCIGPLICHAALMDEAAAKKKDKEKGANINLAPSSVVIC